MKKAILTTTAIALIAAAVGYYAGSAAEVKPMDNEKPARNVLYWYDPMVPGQRFDKPGKSPFMDMQLVPRYADEEKTTAGISISPQQQQNLGIVVEAAQLRQLKPQFQAWATVTTDERSLQTVPSPANGVVEKLFVRAAQQWVRAGEPLAQLWIPSWTTAQQEYLAVRQLGDAALTRAARERLALQFMPEGVIRAVERSGKPQTRLTLRAEQAGYVVKLDAREGAQVIATAPLFELASLDPVWLVVDYPQSQAGLLNVDSEVVVSSESLPGQQFHGRVSELLPQLETTTRTLKARVVLENRHQQLKPGMYVRVATRSAPNLASVLAIPEQALIATGNQNRVILASSEGHFQAVNVTPGMTSDGWTEIRHGLKEGDRVVTSGQFLIDSEASLRSALPKEANADQHDHSTREAD